MKQLLRFEECFQKGKTKNVYVYSTHSGDYLGMITWRTGWRCYVMFYKNDIDMSEGCMRELCIFMDNLEKERKQKIKGEK